MGENKITSDLLRGHTDTMILRLLSEADRYGYEIVKLIAERSGGEYELKEATMYSSVRRLEADGDIEWYWGDESQGGRRKYFRITEKGKATCASNSGNWEYAKRVLDKIIARRFGAMNDKLTNYLNDVFAPYDGVKSVDELKADLLSDLQERFREFKAEGKDDETAFEMTIDSIGDIEQTVQEVANLSRSLERQVLTNFSGSNLSKSDFAGVTAHKGRFEGSALRGSDFSGSDLTGSSFKGSDVREANFDGTNLTDCNLTAMDLRDASFVKSILVRTNFSVSGLDGSKFIGVKLTDVKFNQTDLRKTTFESCTFSGVDFNQCDLRGMCLDGQTFIGVKFDNAALNEASFKAATLKNVSFLSAYTWHSWSKKYYRAIKTICFDGAKMDKLTYAALKGLEADLSKVTVI